jgi:hypothetical protein
VPEDHTKYLQLLLTATENLKVKLSGSSVDYVRFKSIMKLLSTTLYVPSLKPDPMHIEYTYQIAAQLKSLRRLIKDNSADKMDVSQPSSLSKLEGQRKSPHSVCTTATLQHCPRRPSELFAKEKP